MAQAVRHASALIKGASRALPACVPGEGARVQEADASLFLRRDRAREPSLAQLLLTADAIARQAAAE